MANVVYDDLSGTSTPVTSNPYDGILQACNNDPHQIQTRYTTHRTTRNTQQRQTILSPSFPGWLLDPNLTQLTGPQSNPSFIDPRNCVTFWARPPHPIRSLIHKIQQSLLLITAPGLWIMPLPNLHMTALEPAHSLTPTAAETLVTTLLPTSKTIADLPSTPGHAARLIKPMLSFDTAAFALTFVPAAGESPTSPRTANDDTFTYHHLRRTLCELVGQSITVASRYVVPSAHLTLARFNTPNPFVESSHPDALDGEAGTNMADRERLISKIEEINAWLQEEYWPSDQREVIPEGGEWIVGEEKGLDFRKGRLWYGGGETVYLGRAIEKQ